MALEEFEKPRENKLEKNIIRMRSITNYVMGVLLIIAGGLFLLPVPRVEEFLLRRYDPQLIKIFGIVCWVYGLFRLYRGYKKNYFRES